MPRQQQRMTELKRALARATTDGEFRAQVLADGGVMQTECGLNDADWHTLCTGVERIEHTLVSDPLVATEVDHGEADAAGVKS